MRMSSTFVSMDFQQSVSMMYQFSIFCLLAQAITTQNVVIGDTIMQTDRTAQISCTFDDGFVSALYWSVGPLGGSVIPADSIILYSPGLGVIIRNPAYEGRINMTDDYGLIIYEVQDEDIDLRYWCHVNVDGRTGEDSEDAVKAVPIKPTLKVSQQCGECCDAGETVLCEVDGFTPAGDFNIMWKVDGEEDPDGTLILVPSGNVSYANSTLKIKKGSAEEQIYTCEAMGRAYTYATSEENHSNITIDVCKGAFPSAPTQSSDPPDFTSSPPKTTEGTTPNESTDISSTSSAVKQSSNTHDLTSSTPKTTERTTAKESTIIILSSTTVFPTTATQSSDPPETSSLYTSTEHFTTQPPTMESSTSLTPPSVECSEDPECDLITQKCGTGLCECRQSYTLKNNICIKISTKSASWKLDEIYNNDLADPESELFQKKASEQNKAMDAALANIDDYEGSSVLGFSEGSILTKFQIFFDIQSEISTEDIESTIQSAINNGILSDVAVMNGSLQVTELDECKEGLHECSDNAECINTESDYSCKCNGGYKDKIEEKPGFYCIEDVKTGLTESQKLSIGLSIGLGLPILFVLSVILFVIVKRQKAKVDDSSDK